MAWLYSWNIRYYGKGNYIRDFNVRAKNHKDALRKLHEQVDVVLEILWCRRTDRY